jgi:hypothetical protein
MYLNVVSGGQLCAGSLPYFSPSNADGGPSASFNFEEISKMKQELYHIGTRGYGIDILCENIFVKDDVLFLLISLKNGSAVSYVPRAREGHHL